MHTFIILLPFLIASSVWAGEVLVAQPLAQYNHEQNTATGEYGYNYYGGPFSKTEFRASDGTTTGAYNYIDAHGILQTVNYIADEFGFRAAGSNIPSDGVVPLDAPDVAAVKAAHLAEHSRATLAALSHRKKRGILEIPVIATVPIAHAALPAATSSQSRVQIHKSGHLIAHQPLAVAAVPLHTTLFRKKRGILAGAYTAPIYAQTIEHVPFSRSSQNRFQIHNNAKIIQEYHQPIYAAAVAAAPIIETRATLPLADPIVAAPIVEHLPTATSRQNRFQVHSDAKFIQEYHQPLFAAAAPVAHAYLPARDYIPSSPVHEINAPAGDSVTSAGESSDSDEAVSVESA